MSPLIKFVYSEKATQFCEISTLLLSTVHTDKSKVEILQNFMAFSEYMNFIKKKKQHHDKKNPFIVFMLKLQRRIQHLHLILGNQKDST